MDEIGFVTLHKEASELLFQIVSECYEQKSLIITGQTHFYGRFGGYEKKVTEYIIAYLKNEGLIEAVKQGSKTVFVVTEDTE